MSGQRVRFSPAPTGELHIGGARTALFNWLVARRSGGEFIVRIEDTDVARAEARHEAGLLEDLAWLGLDHDEGPDVGGPLGPYRQSERGRLYREALDRLRAEGSVYPCFCPPALLAEQRARDAAEGRAPRYRGQCRCLSREEAGRRLEAGESATWRFAVPDDTEIVFEDAVHGRVSFRGADLGDLILARSDGTAVYDLACVVDDAAMRVTTVVRGDDHLANTARQLLLYEALGFTPPRFAHLPLVTAPGGEPLSKSIGSASIRELREAGYLPAAVVNHCVLLGWSHPNGTEVLTREESIEAFDLSRVSASPSSHDPVRLRWLDQQHLRRLDPPDLLRFVRPFLPPLPPWLDALALVETLAEDLRIGSDVTEPAEAVARGLEPDQEARALLGGEDARRVLDIALDALAAAEEEPPSRRAAQVRDALVASGHKARETLPVVRAALTGRAHGLPLAALLSLLPQEVAVARLSDVSATGQGI